MLLNCLCLLIVSDGLLFICASAESHIGPTAADSASYPARDAHCQQQMPSACSLGHALRESPPAISCSPSPPFSPHMSRYNFIRRFYPAFRFLAHCYFALVNALFSLYNAFQPANQVHWPVSNSTRLLFLTISQTIELILHNKINVSMLVRAHIDRIDQVNPLLNAVVHHNFSHAIQSADQMDRAIQSERRRHKGMEQLRAFIHQNFPLAGIPFSVKANIEAEGFPASACNIHLMNQKSRENAPIVQNLIGGSGIALAQTAMPNLGLSWACDDSACGQVNNPHDSRRIPGGSSSGEGALIAAGGSPFGVGNDIGGSIRIPANFNGIFGLKPTSFPNHTLSLDGMVPASFAEYKPALDMLSNGLLARYAADMPLLMAVMAKKPKDHFMLSVDFLNGFKLFYLEDIEILISEKLHAEQRDAVRRVKKYFEEKYNLAVQKVEFPLMNHLFEFWGLTGWTPGVKPMGELWNEFFEIRDGNANQTFLGWSFEILKNFVAPKDDQEREFMARKLAKLRRQVGSLLGGGGLLLTPLWPTEVPFHHMEPFTAFNLRYTQIFNLLGLPALSVPIGTSPSTNLPLGVQLVASPFNEALLMAAGIELEKAFGGWVPPGNPPAQLFHSFRWLMDNPTHTIS